MSDVKAGSTEAANTAEAKVKGSSRAERAKKHLEANPYVVKVGKRITYTENFYMDLYHIYEEHPDWTAVMIYGQLGFDTEIVGKERAEQALYRAKKMAESGELFKVNPEDIDFSAPLEEQLEGMDMRKQIEYLKTVVHMERTLISALKKKHVKVEGRDDLVLVDQEVSEELYKTLLSIADNAGRIHSMSAYCAMFGVCPKSFHEWYSRKTARDEQRKKDALDQRKIAQHMKEIIEKRETIPGARLFMVYLYRIYGVKISRKRTRRIMKNYGFIATVKRKDPYLGHDTHGLSCIAMNNHVNGDFLKGPREIILTDITYVFYGENRERLYVCFFFDPFTNQVLGFSRGRKMDVALVTEAFNMMIGRLMLENNAHNKQEFRNTMLGKTTYIHSDEGSQFISHRFRDLLEENGLLQSMSDRGCSTDNAPIEALWSTFKAYVPIERAANYQQACTMIDTFVDKYNNEYIQPVLTFLAPNQYYNYVMDPNHIYPFKDCFGVNQDDLIGPDAFESICRKRRQQRTERRKETEKKRREKARTEDDTEGLVTPPAAGEVLNKDGSLKSEYNPVRQTDICILSLKKFKTKWEKTQKGYEEALDNSELMIKKIDSLIDSARKGKDFLKSLSMEDLKRYGHDRDLWQQTPELKFAFDYEEFLENLA